MKFSVILAFCCFFNILFISKAQEHWIEGKVFFTQDSSFTGHFKFHSHVDKEIIALKEGNRILALPPKEIKSAQGFVDGEYRKWRVEGFTQENADLEVYLFLEEIYAGKRYILYKKDLSFIKWSPYANILANAVAFDSYRHLINTNALLLKDLKTQKITVINRSNSWHTNKFMLNKSLLSTSLGMKKKKLKAIVQNNDLKIDQLDGIVEFFMVLEQRPEHQLSLYGQIE